MENEFGNYAKHAPYMDWGSLDHDWTLDNERDFTFIKQYGNSILIPMCARGEKGAYMAVDILSLPHSMFVTTANVTDRNGALSMIGYAVPNLSRCLIVLVDGGYTSENFANKVKELIGAEVEVVKRNLCSDLPSFPNGGLSNLPSVGLRIIVCYGKTANVKYLMPYKLSKWSSFRCY